eukprot:CAMPEP_0205948906 /NCGR_PEP_ID=MMETSP1459-20131121/1171_1 /ASSEMBLY_ACC=CAM_ASM_001120 /TAXON_ID=41880 /ORGANISM="Pycnococcus provasolii, Strain RCC931" /LENGTH=30 /DNA_ID= /DNA_START= /DNA_END= /DNA_ORIENTATION=
MAESCGERAGKVCAKIKRQHRLSEEHEEKV